jgi:hypothetical protein
MVMDFEHLLAINTSSFENCLISYFAHLCDGLLNYVELIFELLVYSGC